MKLVEKISSFILDTAVALLGMAFVGVSAQMFAHDIQVSKKGDKKNGD
jgi:hypothetical protein